MQRARTRVVVVGVAEAAVRGTIASRTSASEKSKTRLMSCCSSASMCPLLCEMSTSCFSSSSV
ncbi:MAG: hypothetical protein LC774_16885 [Acidobacteria bacterium]|nr:hypothetical protein [Acidobacteriota bacterium]